jgi:nucleoside phosphorylase
MALEEVPPLQHCRLYRGRYASKDILLVQTGVGRQRAETAARLVLEHFPVTTLISLGFAGALTEELKVGDVILCSVLRCGNGWTHHQPQPEKPYRSDINLISLLSPVPEDIGFYCGSSVTVAKLVSGPAEKRALGQAFGADIVDMEGYWVARMASSRRVPFVAIRAVLDTVPDSLPDFDRWLDSDDRWRWTRAIPYFLSHPKHLVELPHLYRKANQARKSLTDFVSYLITRL